MNRNDLDEILLKTLDDLRLTRTEKRALGEVFAEEELDVDDVAFIRSRAFELAHQQLSTHEDRQILNWLEEVVKVLQQQSSSGGDEHLAQALFSGRDDCAGRIIELIDEAKQCLEVCVFTITDDRISRSLEAAHRRGLRVLIITDDDKSFDRGSDIDRLSASGISVRVDHSTSHMHHKFALFDRRILLTGSYNWTRGASDDNEENVVIVEDPRLIAAYTKAFRELWTRLEK